MQTTPLYTKIVSLPTNQAWSQTYSAGNLAALISLTFKTTSDDHDKDRLLAVGKELLSILESEYFTLEEKTLHSIKQAIMTVCEKVPDDIHANIVVSTLVATKAYLLLWGGGKIFIKRDGKFGLLLEAKTLALPVDMLPSEIESISGSIQPGDLLFLVSEQLLGSIPEAEFLHYFINQDPTEAGEQIEPLLHHKRQGGASAIVIQTPGIAVPIEKEEIISGPIMEMPEEPPVIHSAIQEEITEHDTHHFSLPKMTEVLTKRTILFGVAAIILFLLVGMILKSLVKQPAVNAALFQSVYSQASSKYDEGQNLETLNRPAAYDDYVAAQKLLMDSKANFASDTKESQQLNGLLAKITEKITATSGMNIVSAKPVDLATSNLLNQKMLTPQAEYVTQEANTIYLVTPASVTGYDTDTKQSAQLIKNASDWTSVGGIGAYFGAVYLLDKSQGNILKFTKSGTTYAKSTYFPKNSKFDFSHVTDIAIDGSIWILEDNGSISDYTKGTPNSFTVKGLEKPFSHATRITTTSDDGANLYVLDTGNSRIVALSKDGTYLAQYSAAILKDATEIDVHQTDKTAFILSGGKVYQIIL